MTAVDLVPRSVRVPKTPEAHRRRAERLLSLELDYHICRPFDGFSGKPDCLPPGFASLNEQSRVSAAEEAQLFAHMNYCKFRADRLRRSLSPREPSVPQMKEIEAHLAAAMKIRNRLIHVFLKLGVSILRPFLSARLGFEELYSEAAVVLLRAVERFDPRRGYRFSTYATTAIRRGLERYVMNQHRDGRKLVPVVHLDGLPLNERRTPHEQRQLAASVEHLNGMLGRLDDREETIVRARYGLGDDCGCHSLQQVADRFGVCRERIRQLEHRAIEKLRAMPEAERLLV